MMKPMTTTPTPLVSREALLAFTQRLVERYAPEKVILYSCGEACGYGSLARGDARWDSDADILVVMPFEGRHLAKIREMRRLCPVDSPWISWSGDRRRWRFATGGAIRSCAKRLTMERFCMVEPWSAVPEWIAKAEGDWEALEILLTRNSPGLRDAVVFHAQQLCGEAAQSPVDPGGFDSVAGTGSSSDRRANLYPGLPLPADWRWPDQEFAAGPIEGPCWNCSLHESRSPVVADPA